MELPLRFGGYLRNFLSRFSISSMRLTFAAMVSAEIVSWQEYGRNQVGMQAGYEVDL